MLLGQHAAFAGRLIASRTPLYSLHDLPVQLIFLRLWQRQGHSLLLPLALISLVHEGAMLRLVYLKEMLPNTPPRPLLMIVRKDDLFEKSPGYVLTANYLIPMPIVGKEMLTSATLV